jgi:hypothetical protein
MLENSVFFLTGKIKTWSILPHYTVGALDESHQILKMNRMCT